MSFGPNCLKVTDNTKNTRSWALSPLQEKTESSELSSISSMESNSPSSSIDPDTFLGPEFTPQSLLPTFKIVGDNIDKEVKPRNMRSDYQARSLHYFHLYAVKDRIDLSKCEDQPSAPDVSSIDLQMFLPSDSDDTTLRRNMGMLIARVLMKHIPFFTTYGKGIEQHIRHQFTEEMSQKSTVVCSQILKAIARCLNYIPLYRFHLE